MISLDKLLKYHPKDMSMKIGDFSFMEDMIKYCDRCDEISLFHIDSINAEGNPYHGWQKRFQGTFLIDGGTYDSCPLEILKKATNYYVTNNGDHLVWTIYFD